MPVGIDVDLLKSEIKNTYACLSQEPGRDFIFPTGRAWAQALDYPPELANVPEAAVESFAGVANPWELGRLSAGEQAGRDVAAPARPARGSASEPHRPDRSPPCAHHP